MYDPNDDPALDAYLRRSKQMAKLCVAGMICYLAVVGFLIYKGLL